MKESILIKKQTKVFEGGRGDHFVRATVRYDDQCGNGHNTFSITGEVYGTQGCSRDGVVTFNGYRLTMESGGCVHEDIAKYIPQLEPYIKWHLCSSDGPMHYIANTIYHADDHGPTYAWVYYKGPQATDPIGLGDDGEVERLLGYIETSKAKKAEGVAGYRVEWDMKTVKTRNLDHVRASAIWLDATDEELMQDPKDLEKALKKRLPKLMEEFAFDMELLGFTY